MRKSDRRSYTETIKWRIRLCWMLLAAMRVYMVVMGEIGGDSRIMTRLADITSRGLFFGGFAYLVSRIVHNKKLLKDRALLKEQLRTEQDERNQYLHDKSGGIVLDVLLVILLFITVTAALLNMAAFYVSFAILAAAVLLKITAYLVYSRR